jgi:opacity protein-like surface antigen
MKKFVLAVFVAAACVSVAGAQSAPELSPAAALAATPAPILAIPVSLPNAPLAAFSEPAPRAPFAPSATSFALPSLADAVPAANAAPFGTSDGLRWQLAVGADYVRFHSNEFSANMVGLHTSATYFATDWLGLEGSVTAAFGSKVFANETTRYLLYTVGPKIAWQGPKWQPFVHALVGGLHMIPQTAGHGQNGFAVQLGGGVDYRLSRVFSARIDADYVRSQLYSTDQNNFQVGGGVVFHF